MPDDFLFAAGIQVPYFVAGFMGAVSIAFDDRKPKAWDLIGTLMAGASAANYITPHIDQHVPGLLAAYFIGTAGKFVAKRASIFVRRTIERSRE